MSKRLLGMVAGAALLAGAAATHANAGPLTLTTDQLDQVTAGGFAFVDGNLRATVHENVKKHVFIDKAKFVFQDVFVNGFLAEALAGANCHGFGGCQATTYAITDVDSKGSATSVSGSESATNGFFFTKF